MKDDLHLANKISNKHINYAKAKMNVRLAAQTLSNSVADAIDFMREDEHHPDFINSEATCQFIRNIDQLFNLCNSRNPIANGLKSKVDGVNLKWKTSFFRKLCNYLKELTDKDGKPLVEDGEHLFLVSSSQLSLYVEFVKISSQDKKTLLSMF
ncbi:THAP domain-containing protein [Elysia marginata]|uniref:THAP domain-containing protein n=1 Tax=Elysia marginata TaxID=1093978 RepID=A0AAV4GXC6_9GAST|nr:THAP domain-containing protein [Elysia marginata]